MNRFSSKAKPNAAFKKAQPLPTLNNLAPVQPGQTAMSGSAPTPPPQSTASLTFPILAAAILPDQASAGKDGAAPRARVERDFVRFTFPRPGQYGDRSGSVVERLNL
jgi:hypothetical protein